MPDIEFKVLDLSQTDQWDEYLSSAGADDIYYRPEYLAMLEANGDGLARLAVYKGPEGIVVYPFLLRAITLPPSSAGLFDIASPYGYSGPFLSSEPARQVDLAKSFRANLHEFCLNHRIVSEFVRFHPLLENWNSFESLINTVRIRNTVFVDLRRSFDDIWHNSFEGRIRTSVRKADRMGVKVSFSNNSRAGFVPLYRETMRRLGAERYYYFGTSYFSALDSLVSSHGIIIHAIYNGKIIASAVVLKGRSFAHYHLSASNSTFRNIPGTDLILMEAVRWAQAQGATHLHLGGGYAGDDDSLFRFKAGFSPDRATYMVGKVVHAHETYAKLVHARFPRGLDTDLRCSYFPLYRSPKQDV